MLPIVASDLTCKPHCGRAGLLAAALLVAAVWMIYWQSLNAPMVCDDSITIVENDSLRRLWPLVGDGELRGPLNPANDLPTSGRPLVNLSFAINYQVSGLATRGYRIVSVLLHTLNVLLLAALVHRGLRLKKFNGRFDSAAGPIAFAVALLWAVHPLNTEAVVYLTQRTELMVSFFYLLTTYASLRFLTERQATWGFAATLACWAGMASKEIMATAPVMILLFDRTFIAGTLRDAWPRSRAFYIGMFTSWLLLVCLAGPGPRSASAGFDVGVTATDWWLTQSKVLLMYLRLAIWPWPLSAHYEPPYLTSLAAAWPYVLPVAVLAVTALVLLWKRSSVGYLLSFALAILAPTLVVPIATEIAAERRMYLPLAALITLAISATYLALQKLFSRTNAIRLLTGAAVALAAMYFAVSTTRLETYRDELVLWQDVVEHDPANPTAHYNVGTTLLERGSPAEALTHFQTAIDIRPDYARAYHNLGSALGALSRRDEATQAFEKAIELEPRYALGHVKLGLTALQAGDAEEAQRHFEKAIQVSPHDAEAHAALASLLLEQGKLEDAIRHGRAAVDGQPKLAKAHNVLGSALARQQLYTEAIEQFEAAVALDPALLQAQGNLMAAYAAAGRSAEALAAAEAALATAREQGNAEFAAQITSFLSNLATPPTESSSRSTTHPQQ